jgi:hypothetical protein
MEHMNSCIQRIVEIVSEREGQLVVENRVLEWLGSWDELKEKLVPCRRTRMRCRWGRRSSRLRRGYCRRLHNSSFGRIANSNAGNYGL